MTPWVLISSVLTAPSYDSNIITTQWTTIDTLQENILIPPDKTKSSFIYNPIRSFDGSADFRLYGKDFGLIKEDKTVCMFVTPILYEYNQPGFTDHFRKIWIHEHTFSTKTFRLLICEK